MWNDNEFNSTFSSPGGNSKDAKKTLIKHIVPVTAHVINNCQQVEGENSVFELNSLRFHQICLVGIIRNVIKRANDITYLIDDMTSENEINVKLQTDDSDDIEFEDNAAKQAQAQFIENQYVKVFGIIKSLQGQKNVQAFRIMPIKDLNEVTHHLLDCMSATIYYESKGGCGDSMPMHGGPSGIAFKDTSSNGNTGGLSGIVQAVNAFIKTAKSGEGYHVKEIFKFFKDHPESKLRETLEFLGNEGHIYTTIDDEHFKTTEAFESS